MQRTVHRLAVNHRWATGSPGVSILELRGERRGPTVAVTANVHGDEVTGVRAVQRLDRWLRSRPLAGTVFLYPTLNPEGMVTQTRHVPEDGQDLNRAFPGSARGGHSERLAYAIWEDLEARNPDVLVDLHSDSADSIPYVIVDRPASLHGAARRRLAGRLLELADATGLTVLREYPDELYLRFGLDRSLAGAAVNLLGIPAVTLETGPRRFVDPRAVDAVLNGVIAVLAAAGSVQARVEPHPTRVDGGPWRRSSSPRARKSGLLVPITPAGSTFNAGDRLAMVTDLAGDTVQDVIASDSGVVIAWFDGGWVGVGHVLGTMAVHEGSEL